MLRFLFLWNEYSGLCFGKFFTSLVVCWLAFILVNILFSDDSLMDLTGSIFTCADVAGVLLI